MKNFKLESGETSAATPHAPEPYRIKRLSNLRLLVYSHDTFGLGNIRRMLAICEHLRASIPGISILIVSGSPMVHSFRAVDGIDYIKLPCLRRNEEGNLGVRFLSLDLPEVARLRRELILATVQSFRPDAVFVDKVPNGLAGELEPSLRHLKCSVPHAKVLLVLRDILDSGQKTVDAWRRHNSYSVVQWYYDGIAVLGDPGLFDVRTEYQFPQALHRKTWFCGYVAKHERTRARGVVRRELEVPEGGSLVLVTTGGGEDGYQVLENYLNGLGALPETRKITSLIVTGPDLSVTREQAIRRLAQNRSRVLLFDFTDDMMSYVNAADVVVSMAGYNTICEILSFRKRAVVIPRVRPVEEQWIRAARMAHRSLFKMILPTELSPTRLMNAVTEQLDSLAADIRDPAPVDLGALPRIAQLLMDLLAKNRVKARARTSNEAYVGVPKVPREPHVRASLRTAK